MDSIRITKKELYTANFNIPSQRFTKKNISYFNGTIGLSYFTFDRTNDSLVIPNYDNKLDLCNNDF